MSTDLVIGIDSSTTAAKAIAFDRSGLLRDITTLLANEKINLTGANTKTDAHDGIARMNLTLEISDISQLSRVLTRIGQLQNVIAARRKS